MVTDINALIDFFKKYTPQTESKDEIGEQDAAPASSAPSSGGGGGSVPKWSDFYTLTRGKANMLGKAGEKWNTGLNRGAANQIW
jgi:hypothetical protein